jgi:hypothetical protein
MKHILIIALMLFSVVGVGMDRPSRHNPYGRVNGRPPLARHLFGPRVGQQAPPAVGPSESLSGKYEGFEFIQISGPAVPTEVLRAVLGHQILVNQNTAAPSAQGAPIGNAVLSDEQDQDCEEASGLSKDSVESSDDDEASGLREDSVESSDEDEVDYDYFS